MRISLKRLEPRITTGPLSLWPRIIPARHASTPASAGPGSSRFSSLSNSFTVLYAAEDFGTAFAEAVVRDRFEDKKIRFLYRPHIEALRVTDISSTSDLTLLDLTKGGTFELGLDTNITRQRKHKLGQTFSEALHNKTHLDGIIFDSRLTGSRCIAIYNRAFTRISGSPAIEMVNLAAFYNEVRRLKIIVRRQYGTGP